MFLGVDVSNFQKTFNWQKAKQDGISFGYAKASEGTDYVDPFFDSNLLNAKSFLVPLGPYHFGRPDHHPGVGGARAEADWFCGIIRGKNWKLRPVLDLETGSGDLTTWAGAFLARVEANVGVRPLLYSYTGFLSHLNLKALPGYNLWIADYGVNDGLDHLARVLNVDHQFTSRGVLEGIIGNLDLNHAPSLGPLFRPAAPSPTPSVPVPNGEPKNQLPFTTKIWPVPLPEWFWAWAQWRKDGQTYERPVNAPLVIPPWAWVRLKALG